MRGWKEAVCCAVVTATSLLAAASAQATYPGANGQIAFGPNDLELINSDGSGRTTLLDVSGFEVSPAWSPDGTRVAFEVLHVINPPNFQSVGIWVADSDGTNAEQIVSGIAEDPSWSPDGERIVFGMQQTDTIRYDLYTVNADGTGLAPLTNTADQDERDPSWSVDNRIAFARRAGQAGIWVMETPDAAPTFLTAGGEPDWSPFGDELVIKASDGIRRVQLASATGTVIFESPSALSPSFAPDGRTVLFTINRGGGGGMTCCQLSGDIWTVAYDGSSSNALALDGWQTAWRPLPAPTAPRYVRPKGASPLRASLVPAYNPCASPNRTHGPPLSFGSCNAPSQTSTTATIGTPDANGQAARSTGSIVLSVQPGDPGTAADEADVAVSVSMSDVRRASDLADYPWSLDVPLSTRITERNGSDQYTVREPAENTASFYTWPLRLTVPCTTTPDPAAGSDCTLSTTLDAVLPGSVAEGRRGVWGLGQVRVNDSGPDADAVTTDDNELFAVQGVFVP